MKDPKPWYKSKTILLNLAAGLLVAVEATTNALGDTIPQEALGLVAAGLAAANVVLRALSGQPISVKKPASRPPSP